MNYIKGLKSLLLPNLSNMYATPPYDNNVLKMKIMVLNMPS